MREFARKECDLFKKNGITRIGTKWASWYHAFKEVYQGMVRDWDIEVEHVAVTILNVLKRKGIKFKGMDVDREVVCYHDSCYLGRYSGIYEEPREVIERLGGKIFEFMFNRENAYCCGGGGGMRDNFPKVAKAVANKKVSFVHEHDGEFVASVGLG